MRVQLQVTRAESFAVGSIAVGVVVLALKAAAWRLTGSTALFSDAAETVVNVGAAFIAVAALRLAARPADAVHPYGYTKAELFSATVEGALIVLAAITILQHAWTTFHHPSAIDMPFVGLAVNALATVFNVAWATVLVRRGKVMRSPALIADGKHLYSDVVTSAGVFVGVSLVIATRQLWLDPTLAAATAIYILISGMLVIRESLSSLLDAAPPQAIVQRIRALVREHAAGALEAHDLRSRHAGQISFLEFHLVVPGDMTVSQAHAICDRIEAALKAEVDGLNITIHVEPEGKAKHTDVIVP